MTETIPRYPKESHLVSINDPVLLAVPVEENHEPLTSVVHPRIVKPSDLMSDIKQTDGTIILRKSVAAAFIRAVEALPARYGLVLIEGSRTYAVQESLFQAAAQRIMDKSGGTISAAEAQAIVEKYVANPAKYAPHVTGAAVDVSLVQRVPGPDGRERWGVCDVGNNAFEYNERAATAYPNLSEEQRRNRAMLQTVMEQAGFTNYPLEFWHYSMGDRLDAYAKGGIARFGELQ